MLSIYTNNSVRLFVLMFSSLFIFVLLFHLCLTLLFGPYPSFFLPFSFLRSFIPFHFSYCIQAIKLLITLELRVSLIGDC